MTQTTGPNGALSMLFTMGKLAAWKTAQTAFLAGRLSCRAWWKTHNDQKSVQNTDTSTCRENTGTGVGSATDTFGCDDDHKVPEPSSLPVDSDPMGVEDAKAILELMKDMMPDAQIRSLRIMENIVAVHSGTVPPVHRHTSASARPAILFTTLCSPEPFSSCPPESHGDYVSIW
ncbi:hypothetical protein B0H10DRAFT_1948847 [Mycena sp. CBHHK59/15]|nr:hypothetical protein B0H10DRAFT_1948847 [Mycena sp. CBHHK59/15]